MNEFYRLHLERLERELALRMTRLQWAPVVAPARWSPAVNAYRCANQFVICVDLAGVAKESLNLEIDLRRVILHGHRTAPEPPCDAASPPQVLVMEIDYGPFERTLVLPEDVDPDRASAEHHAGLLWIRIPVRWPAAE